MKLIKELPVVENISHKEFLEKFFYPQKPCIIKGLIKNTPAEKWDFNYMKKELGHVEVDVFDNSINKTSAYVGGDKKMKFSEFIDIILKNEDKCPYRLFLFNGFKHSKKLQQDFPCPAIFKGILDDVGFMFFGGKNTVVRMHYDIDMSAVLHTHFYGKKRVLLVPYEYTKYMYRPYFNTYSIADFDYIDNIDFNKYPALKKVTAYDIYLEHGDSLFMPCGWWHYMIYLDPSFSVAYRKFPHGLKNIVNGALNLTTRLWTDKILNYLLHEKWSNWKKQNAIERSNRFISIIN
ncbi:MAG: hypothetical protein KatS3mg027_1276 [Bacteroidia bacterium]|nr:MAG: hypothetical protein KatS3mg027_1276 [Bacteroidia bacterium]